MRFEELALDERIAASIAELGFEEATPIQAEAIAPLLAGHDIIGQARTGSGKTAAFGLPLLERVKNTPKGVRALVLAPTRELALQVTDALRSYSKGLPVRLLSVYGGAPYPPQLKALRKGVQVVVGTPGRVLDHIERGSLDLSKLELLVLDEADEMLRMGFIEAIEEVLEATPPDRQIALFSATMPKPIQKVASRFLNDPVHLHVESEALSVDHIDQRWMKVPDRHKTSALIRLLKTEPRGGTLIFSRTRRRCAEVADELMAAGINADAIHGELSQAARERVLRRLRGKSLQTLVATDVAARGLDVSHLTHVINLDFPGDTEAYVHRIGRTGRAGSEGNAITFVTHAEQKKLRFLQKATGVQMAEMDVASDAQVAAAERYKILKDLKKIQESKQLEDTRVWLEELLDDEELSAEDLASAAILLLAQQRGLSIQAPKTDRLPDWAQKEKDKKERKSKRSKGEKPDFNKVNEVEIFIGIGKTAGVRPADIVGAIANDAGIPGHVIGKVSLFDQKAFVGLSKADADQLLESHPTLEIRGKSVHLKLARPRKNREEFGWKKPKRGGFKKRGDKPFRSRNKSGGGPKAKKRNKSRGD